MIAKGRIKYFFDGTIKRKENRNEKFGNILWMCENSNRVANIRRKKKNQYEKKKKVWSALQYSQINNNDTRWVCHCKEKWKIKQKWHSLWLQRRWRQLNKFIFRSDFCCAFPFIIFFFFFKFSVVLIFFFMNAST